MREYHYPDFLPVMGQAVLVRDLHTAPWMLATFHAYSFERCLWQTAEGYEYHYCAEIEYADVEPWRPGNKVDSFNSLVFNSSKGPFYLRKVFWSERARRWQAEDGSKYLHCAQVPMRVLRGEYKTLPVIYTKEDQPLWGQPILVRDSANEEWTARIFLRFSAGDCAPWKVMSSVADDVGYRYAAHYDEQFWLAQQKKKAEPVDASKQAEKLAAHLAKCCGDKHYWCPTGIESCPIYRPCCEVTKDDWLAWAAKQEN